MEKRRHATSGMAMKPSFAKAKAGEAISRATKYKTREVEKRSDGMEVDMEYSLRPAITSRYPSFATTQHTRLKLRRAGFLCALISSFVHPSPQDDLG